MPLSETRVALLCFTEKECETDTTMQKIKFHKKYNGVFCIIFRKTTENMNKIMCCKEVNYIFHDTNRLFCPILRKEFRQNVQIIFLGFVLIY